jgi:glutathione synthase/RimK-type ligase-like ATP-grasp enzyme
MPKIVVFWGKPTGPIDGPNPHPIGRIGKKLPSYMRLLDDLSRSAETYISIGYDNYLGNLKFKNPFKYKDGKFTQIEKIIQADAVYDRSAKMSFPDISEKSNTKVVNSNGFKNFSNSKWKLYLVIPEVCPKTINVENNNEFRQELDKFPVGKKIVAKPHNKFGGKGIYIGDKHDLAKIKIEEPYLLQEFIDTSEGIPNVCIGNHDLRVVVINKKIVWATVRKPAPGSLLANVSQGGNIEEVNIKDLPSSIYPIIDRLTKLFEKKYDNPLFSVDFGFQSGKPYVFEINDQIGFPLTDMKNNTFIKELSILLLNKAKI